MVRRYFCVMVICLTAICGLSLSTVAHAAAPQGTPWDSVVARLDDEQYSVREEATRKLVDAGPAAIPLLVSVIEGGSSEAAWRASVVLERMALEGDEAALKAVKHSIDNLAKSVRPGLARMGAELAERQKYFRHERAIAQVKRLGGRVGIAGEMEDEGLLAALPFDLVEEGVELADAEVEMELVEAEPRADDELRALEAEAARLEPLEESFLDKFKAAAKAALVPAPGAPAAADVAELEADAEWEEVVGPGEIAPFEGPVDIAMAEAVELAMEDAEIIGVDFADEMIEEDAESLEANVLVNQHWKGGDAGIDTLREIRSLTTLVIDQSPLTDKALVPIGRIPDLQSLTVRGGKFSAAALRRLHKTRPELQLNIQGLAMLGISTSGSPCTVQRVVPGSGADKAGIKAGDVIRGVDGEIVEEFLDVSFALVSRKVGDKVRVKYERDGKALEVDAELMPRPGT